MTGLKPTMMRRLKGMMFRLPMMITCEAFEDFIVAYLEDDLPPRQKFLFELHLKVCRECREYLRAYRASIDLTRDALTDPEETLPETVPDDLVRAVLEARKSS
ncbi:MAG: zf-HC2 domain-containing protein [Pseudomonadota bacterium]